MTIVYTFQPQNDYPIHVTIVSRPPDNLSNENTLLGPRNDNQCTA